MIGQLNIMGATSDDAPLVRAGFSFKVACLRTFYIVFFVLLAMGCVAGSAFMWMPSAGHTVDPPAALMVTLVAMVCMLIWCAFMSFLFYEAPAQVAKWGYAPLDVV